jgi:hypothetical protein
MAVADLIERFKPPEDASDNIRMWLPSCLIEASTMQPACRPPVDPTSFTDVVEDRLWVKGGRASLTPQVFADVMDEEGPLSLEAVLTGYYSNQRGALQLFPKADPFP